MPWGEILQYHIASHNLMLYDIIQMDHLGTALMGIGQGKGKTRAVDAAMSAISSPLLDFPISKAKGIVFNIVGGPDMTLQEINSAAEVVYEAVDADANIIFGALIDDKITTGEVRKPNSEQAL